MKKLNSYIATSSQTSTSCNLASIIKYIMMKAQFWERLFLRHRKRILNYFHVGPIHTRPMCFHYTNALKYDFLYNFNFHNQIKLQSKYQKILIVCLVCKNYTGPNYVRWKKMFVIIKLCLRKKIYQRIKVFVFIFILLLFIEFVLEYCCSIFICKSSMSWSYVGFFV